MQVVGDIFKVHVQPWGCSFSYWWGFGKAVMKQRLSPLQAWKTDTNSTVFNVMNYERM